ncbi:hypothetical protein GCK72_005828 [Caenorhabditis remanei]|uniref:Histone deacetylase domain-containing protein n=1 Tax=Caenorhabditis remanei TaxID=31234 RepID=A0A6A5HES0_CAERE|nr:hypothetical protein GCK72_005828 [Caenorhabditis remanei]KAF1765875.1 hypothetical protein GCK72_005828 [Caenorhabditis remanei]
MMSTNRVFLIMDEQEEKHDQPWSSYHIETSKRLEVIQERLQTTGLYADLRIEKLSRREASEEEIRGVHTERYVKDVKETETMTKQQQEQFCTKYEDIFVNSATWKRAKLAAGSAIDLVTAVTSHKMPGIAFIRPPGHHAMPDEGCGFCIFNNVAIAAKETLRNGTAKRVMIVDYDVHAANGTQECIESMGENVRLISIHRYENGTFWPNMPQTGIYHNYNNTMNLPLNTTALNDSDYLALFTYIILPSINSYKPDVIIVSSGFDASLGDPEGYMNVTPAGFATMIRLLMNTGIPVAAILEGGYFLEALAADSEWVLRAMLGEPIPQIKLEIINPSIADTKLQELRSILGHKLIREEKQDLNDYKGQRTVHPPYDTRGIYTPFSEEKVNSYKRELESLLQSYQVIEETCDTDSYFIRSESKNVIENNSFFIQNGKLSIGPGKVAKLFFELAFLSSVTPHITLSSFLDVDDKDFSSIRFGDGFAVFKDIIDFQKSPILQL